ncbi:unnamed protein product [Trifolium pratense]|uniref:Uncharacterized protein n=1 Tax=Trifolium pratense TaxID=57577 RepID=A0ACB0LXS6_TRIPR|nr:unnamed protein product [Trifolium pratense]
MFDIEFPTGHIGVKSFDVDIVDEQGNFVPLHETYFHHYFAIKYIINKTHDFNDLTKTFGGAIFKRNDGTCNEVILPHYWGFGSESRGTSTKIPDPFAVELGNPANIPEGWEEKWLFNIMVIDTRGTENRKSCTECRCDQFNLPQNFYNVSTEIHGKPLSPEYKGGIFCCKDNFQCKLIKGFEAPRRKLALRYKVTWVDWDQHQIPLRFYILDSTDRIRTNGSETIHDCLAEYTIPENNSGDRFHVQKSSIPMKKGGYLIYGTAHMHTGVVNATLYGQDGRKLCTSTPRYGTGKEARNEEGYLVEMSDGRKLCTSTPRYGTGKEAGNEEGYLVEMSDGRTLCTSTPRYGTGKEAGNKEGYLVEMFSPNIQSATYLSEKFEVGPEEVVSIAMFDIEFPTGHIRVKSLDVDIVDEQGNSVPLHETYFHHYFAIKYIINKTHDFNDLTKPFGGAIFKRNDGICNEAILPHYWGFGSESRGTSTKIPDPFAVELGNPANIPEGWEEKWLFSIMVIDTRGTENRKSCTECRCDQFNLPQNFYNVSTEIHGKPLSPEYKGGIFCCKDNFQCKLIKGFEAPRRKLALRYKVTWVD